MRQRKQAGQIIAIGTRWHVRYYERMNVNGVIERKRVTHCLGPITTRGVHPPADVVKDAEDHMRGINSPVIPADRTITLTDFVEQVFLHT